MATTELVLCRGFRGVASFACRSLRKVRDSDPLALARTLVVVPTAAAADLLRRQLEDALLSRRSATALPTIATSASLISLLSLRSDGKLRLVDPLLREALLERAFVRAREEGALPPFAVRGGLAARVLEFYDELLARSSASLSVGPDGGLPAAGPHD
jgi:hypothetical protein